MPPVQRLAGTNRPWLGLWGEFLDQLVNANLPCTLGRQVWPVDVDQKELIAVARNTLDRPRGTLRR